MIGELEFECVECHQPLFQCGSCCNLFHAREMIFRDKGGDQCFACYDKARVGTVTKLVQMPPRGSLARMILVGRRYSRG